MRKCGPRIYGISFVLISRRCYQNSLHHFLIVHESHILKCTFHLLRIIIHFLLYIIIYFLLSTVIYYLIPKMYRTLLNVLYSTWGRYSVTVFDRGPPIRNNPRQNQISPFLFWIWNYFFWMTEYTDSYYIPVECFSTCTWNSWPWLLNKWILREEDGPY